MKVTSKLIAVFTGYKHLFTPYFKISDHEEKEGKQFKNHSLMLSSLTQEKKGAKFIDINIQGLDVHYCIHMARSSCTWTCSFAYQCSRSSLHSVLVFVGSVRRHFGTSPLVSSTQKPGTYGTHSSPGAQKFMKTVPFPQWQTTA